MFKMGFTGGHSQLRLGRERWQNAKLGSSINQTGFEEERGQERRGQDRRVQDVPHLYPQANATVRLIVSEYHKAAQPAARNRDAGPQLCSGCSE